MAASKNVCHICHAGYRGAYILHVQTKGHRRKANPAPKRSWSKGKEIGRQIGRQIGRSRRYGERRYSGEGMVAVQKHRRSPPDNGSAKTVRVRNYLRDRARRASSYSYVPEHHYLTPYKRG